MSDRADQLFGEFQDSGDTAALGELYDLVAPELLRVALHLSGDPVTAEDLLQATLVTAIERAASFDPTRPVRPWLAGILAKHARRARERAARRPDPERLERGPESGPQEDAQRAELLEKLDAALFELPENWRPVLALRIRHGLSASEIACALERPPGTVRSQLQRGVESLRRALPASLAGALLFAFSRTSRGLSGVREALIAHAATLAPLPVVAAPIAGKVMFGVLAMNKLAIGAALLGALSMTLVIATRSPAKEDAIEQRSAAIEPSKAAFAREEAPAAPERGATPEATGELRAASHEKTPATSRSAALVDSPEGETCELIVHATWEDGGGPAAGCVVVARNYAQGISFPQELVARTDEQGIAHLTGVLPGNLRVGLLRGESQNARAGAGETREIELRVPRGVDVEVQVVDELGRPVENAGLWLSDGLRINSGHIVARTDANGRALVRSVRVDQFVGARAKGYAPSYLVDPPGAAGSKVRTRLALASRAAPLVGRVVDHAGQPVSGASVLVGNEHVTYNVRLETGSYTPGSPPTRVTTDADGRFAVECAPLGETIVQVRAPGFGPFAGTAQVLPEAGGLLEVALAPEAVVHGALVDAEGTAVVQARVKTENSHEFAGSWVYSGEDGRFELRGLPSGELHLSAGHERAGRAELELELDPGERYEWEPVLVQEARLFGTVRDLQDKPCALYAVAAFDREQSAPNWKGGVTARDGSFSLDGLEDREYELTVNAGDGLEGFPLLRLEGQRPSTTPLDLVVDSTGRDRAQLSGTIFGPGGLPAVGVRVSIGHEELRASRRFEPDAATGRWEASVPPGKVTIRVRSDEHPWLTLDPLEVAAGESHDLGALQLAPATRISGSVRGVEDDHLGSLEITLVDARGREGGVVRFSGREFQSGPLEAGSYTLYVQGDFVAGQEHTVEVEEGREAKLDLMLERTGQRTVRLLPSAPITGRAPYLWCAVQHTDGRRAWLQGNVPFEDGAYVATVSVAPGTYKVSARDQNGLQVTAEFTVGGWSGNQPALELRLEPGESR